MEQTQKHTTPLRRALLACAAGATAVGMVPAAVSAQASEPTPQPIDTFCAEAPAEDDFDDVDDQAWADAVRCLAHAGITSGVAPGRYAPGGSVTRAQMASFVARMMDTAVLLDDGGSLTVLPAGDGTSPFDDVNTGPHAATIDRLHAAGIVQGGPGSLPASSYGPTLPVTRAQMAAFLTRAVEHLTNAPLTGDGNHFDDDDGSIHEDAIDALAANGIAIGYGDRTYRPNAPVQRSSMASFLLRPLASLHAEGTIDALPASPQVDAPLAVASASGVRVLDADGSTRHVVSTDHASNALAIGTDLVVYEDMDGEARVWRAGQGVETIDLVGMSNPLLDARLVDGTPTVLTVELAESRSEAVLVDLTDDTRTTVHAVDDDRHFVSGRILPDGDVVLVSFAYSAEPSDDSWIMERRTPGTAEPVWSTTWGGSDEAEKHVLLQDGTLHSVEATDSGVVGPNIRVTEHDAATGAAVSTRSVDVAAFTGDDWFRCPDLVSADVIICNPDDRAPAAVDLTTGWIRTLPGGPGGTVTEVREDAAG